MIWDSLLTDAIWASICKLTVGLTDWRNGYMGYLY